MPPRYTQRTPSGRNRFRDIIVALRRRGAARAAHTYGSKYAHNVYIGVYVYTLYQFDVWCVTVHVYFLTVYIQTRQMRVSAMEHPARMATEVPISTCCPIPTRPFGGLEITVAVHMSGRDLWRSKLGAQAHLNSRLTVSTRPDRACAG
jgi:hypothetical protein